MKTAGKFTKGMAVVNVIATGAAVVNDLSKGKYKSAATRTAVWGIAATASLVPGFGWGLALGIGIADAIWGDQFYGYVEKNW